MRVAKAGIYSDVDIRCYVRQMPVNEAEVYTMRYQDGYLVSIYLTTLENEYASLRSPQKAIWAVPGLRQSRILLDKDGSIVDSQGIRGEVHLGVNAGSCRCLCFLESVRSCRGSSQDTCRPGTAG